MCEIIAFQPSGRQGSQEAPPVGGAQILFFLGVRYERMEEPAPAAAPDTRGGDPAGGKKRKRRVRARGAA